MARVGTQTCCDESGEHAEFVFIVDSDTVRKSDKKKAWLTLNVRARSRPACPRSPPLTR